ncbi:hypothetical protein WA026_002731 [Henosepilachna vigintioctopunctata]|uniref:Ionotropic receptor n=1 Tax=Henosepilachna vigintioctopunctata TaxID=420089 RepID=A0AAW1TUB9_9CUCU
MREFFFNSRARFLIIGENFEPKDIDILAFNYIHNVLFIDGATGVIYTYFPYEFESLHNISKELKKIGLCDSSGFVLNDGYDMLYPEKIPKIWKNSSISLIYGYEPPMTIGTEEKNKGIEIELFDLILDRIKIKGNYVKKTTINDTSQNVLFKRHFDVYFGNVPSLRIDLFALNDVTVSYLSDSAYWFVPQQAVIPKWKYAFKAFSWRVWLLWLLSAICCSICWCIVYFVMENKLHPMNFLEKIWIIIRLFLEQTIKFKVKFVTQLIYIFLVIQSSFILNLAYKGKYTYFLSGRNYEQQLNSLEDIMSNNLKIGSTRFLIGFFETIPEFRTYMEHHFVNCDTGITCFNRSIFENMAVFKPYRKVSYIRNLFRDKYGRNLHHRITKSITTVWSAAVFSKGHPIFPLVNRYFYLLMDHGFLVKITEAYDQATKRTRRTKRIPKNQKFSFEYFIAPFFILALGYAIGILFLGIEIFVNKTKKIM